VATYQEFVRELSPTWGRGFWGSRFIGMLWAVPADVIGVALTQAIKAPWLHRGGQQPADALPLLGGERNMPRYPVETTAQYQERLRGAWFAWEYAGTKAAIESQYAAAGYPDARVYEPRRQHSQTLDWHGDWEREPLDYWSQFWVFFPQGSHGFSPPPTIGDPGLTIGDEDLLIGATGTYAEVRLLRGLVNKWRPAHVICRELILELTGATIGTGHVIGEPGLVIGGEQLTLGGN
jgi:hypothetical protein